MGLLLNVFQGSCIDTFSSRPTCRSSMTTCDAQQQCATQNLPQTEMTHHAAAQCNAATASGLATARPFPVAAQHCAVALLCVIDATTQALVSVAPLNQQKTQRLPCTPQQPAPLPHCNAAAAGGCSADRVSGSVSGSRSTSPPPATAAAARLSCSNTLAQPPQRHAS